MTERRTAPAKKAAKKAAPAKKAATRKATAPAKKAATRKATAPAANHPETPDQDEGQSLSGSIGFRGRTIRVQMPSPEQVLIWQRTMDKIERANLNDWNGAQVLAALERTRKIIDSVILDEADVDWVDDEMLAGRFGLKEASKIILDALAVFQNRDQRRATKKTAARRKKVS